MTITNETVFNEVIEKMLSNINVSRFESDAKMEAEGDIIYLSKGTNKRIFSSIPYSINNINIHGNRRNKLADEFCRLYKFSDIKNKYNERQNKIEKLEILQDKYGHNMEEILNKIQFLDKYVTRRSNKESQIYSSIHHGGGYRYHCIEVNLLKNEYSSHNIQILLNTENYNTFILRFNYEDSVKTSNEIVEFLNELVKAECEPELQRRENIRLEKKREAERVYTLQKKLHELMQHNVIFKVKNSYICYENGTRYAMGNGKSGKYYRCDFSQLYKNIKKRNINDYHIVKGEVGYWKDDYLQSLEYEKII